MIRPTCNYALKIRIPRAPGGGSLEGGERVRISVPSVVSQFGGARLGPNWAVNVSLSRDSRYHRCPLGLRPLKSKLNVPPPVVVPAPFIDS